MHPGGGGDTHPSITSCTSGAAPAHRRRAAGTVADVAPVGGDEAGGPWQRRCGEALTVLQPSTIQPAAQEPGTTASLVLEVIPRACAYCILICITYAQVMQQQFNHDVRAAEQEPRQRRGAA